MLIYPEILSHYHQHVTRSQRRPTSRTGPSVLYIYQGPHRKTYSQRITPDRPEDGRELSKALQIRNLWSARSAKPSTSIYNTKYSAPVPIRLCRRRPRARSFGVRPGRCHYMLAGERPTRSDQDMLWFHWWLVGRGPLPRRLDVPSTSSSPVVMWL